MMPFVLIQFLLKAIEGVLPGEGSLKKLINPSLLGQLKSSSVMTTMYSPLLP
jgi:hypothetical protein